MTALQQERQVSSSFKSFAQATHHTLTEVKLKQRRSGMHHAHNAYTTHHIET